jgi:DNA-directed RNA polymerase subunit RPC12/RpoP
MALDLSKYEKDSTLIWAVSNIQLPKAAKWDFSNRAWQPAILDDKSQQIVCQKPTQVGMSTVFLIKMLHYATNNTCRLMYTLPRQDDVYDMVNSRLREIIAESPAVKSQLTDIDNVRMKKFGTSFLHFSEMSVPPRMLDVDWIVNDEVDLSNPDNLQQITSRLDASSIGIQHRISTPTIDDFGINSIYKLSDKKQWLVECSYCSFEQAMDWDLNVAHKNEATWYICAKCHNRLYPEDINAGHWVATNPSSPISGYQINQMMVTSITPEKLYSEYEKVRRKTFYNNRLGLPYSAASVTMDIATLKNNCFRSNHLQEFSAIDPDAQYVLGCDQGNLLHVVIGKLSGTQIQIVWLGVIDSFDELNKLIKRFKIRKGVIDALPNHHDSRKIAESSRGKILAAYFTKVQDMYQEQENRIVINKSDSYDELLQMVIDGRLQFYGTAETMDESALGAVTHLANMRRDMGQQVSNHGGVSNFHIWTSVGPEHYADAMLYMILAADITSTGSDFSAIDLSSLIGNKNMSIAEILGMKADTYSPMIENALVPNNPKFESMVKLDNNEIASLNPYQDRTNGN